MWFDFTLRNFLADLCVQLFGKRPETSVSAEERLLSHRSIAELPHLGKAKQCWWNLISSHSFVSNISELTLLQEKVVILLSLVSCCVVFF